MQNPRQFVDKLLKREMSIKEDWPEMNPGQMRIEIREKLYEVQEAQEKGRRRRLAVKAERDRKKDLTTPLPEEEATTHNEDIQNSDALQLRNAVNGQRLRNIDDSKKHRAYKDICSSVSEIIHEKSPSSPKIGSSHQDVTEGSEVFEQKHQTKAPTTNNQDKFDEQVRLYAES